MAKRRRPEDTFFDTATLNNATYRMFYDELSNLALSVYKWYNLPPTVDERFLEQTLYNYGMCVFFEDEVMGHLALTTMIEGPLNVYRIPIRRRAYATNGYQKDLTEDNSVLIWNNFLHEPTFREMQMYAYRLYEVQRAIDTNVKLQKFPYILRCNENQRLTMKNLVMQYEGNEPFIYGERDLDLGALQVLETHVPFLARDLQSVKSDIYNEALEHLGISPTRTRKAERVQSAEVESMEAGVDAKRYVGLAARRQACDQINAMFGLNVQVSYQPGIINNDDFNGDGEDETEVVDNE